MEVIKERWEESEKWATGIFVRAKVDDRWVSADIAVLTPESLLQWLRSGEGKNLMAENTVGILLGHGHIAT